MKLKYLKKSFTLLILSLFFSCNSSNSLKFDCINTDACIEFEKKLKILEDNILYHKQVDYYELIELAKYFEKKTGIESEADVQIMGQLPPTLNDLYNWTSWYSQNYQSLGNGSN